MFFKPFAHSCRRKICHGTGTVIAFAMMKTSSPKSWSAMACRELFATEVKRHYLSLLENNLRSGVLESMAIAGQQQLLESFRLRAQTWHCHSQFSGSRRIALETVTAVECMSDHAQGADGGGHKHEILARLLQRMDVPRRALSMSATTSMTLKRVFAQGVHFIGFSTDAATSGQICVNNGARMDMSETSRENPFT